MTYLIYQNLTRAESDPIIIQTLKRKGWTVRPDPPAYDSTLYYADWNNGTWNILPIPPPPVPAEIPLWAFRVALNLTNLKGEVELLIQGLPEPQRTIALQQYEYGNIIQRNHPLIISLGDELGLTTEEIDTIFINANKLT